MPTILAVDDRAINREFLATLLGYVGYEILEAADGAEALEIARAHRPDLIITDVLMPVMDGVELAGLVHDDPTIADTPIIFYTATYRIAEASMLAKCCRVASVLAKPAEPQAILDAVAAALGRAPMALAATLQTAEVPSFLGAALPNYLRDLSDLQNRLRHVPDGALVETHSVNERSSQTFSSYQTLALRLAELLELGMVLAAKRDPRQLIEMFCSGAQDIMNCRHAIVAILDADARRLQTWATRGLPDETNARLATADPRAGVLGSVLVSGHAYRVRAEDGLATTLGLPNFHPPITSLLLVPLPLRSTASVCGWLCFSDRLGTDAFDAEDEQFAMTLAAELALAYGNLVMYDEIQRHAATLELEVVERRRVQSELAQRMTHDQTTGLPRFVLIEEFLRSAVGDAAGRDDRVLLFYVDLDLFHSINETHGRAVGDRILRKVAERLGSMVGATGRLAHVGADEFAIALIGNGGDASDAASFVEAIRSSVELPIREDGVTVCVSCSVGVSSFPEDGKSPQELLREAERAMLQAKWRGRKSVLAFSNDRK
jgi:diguanylate cyclase (GGDEF)-like protein